jgi:hypothetical protein
MGYRLTRIKSDRRLPLVAHVPDGSCSFVAKSDRSLAAALVTFEAQPLLSHAPYFFIKLRILFIAPSVF